MDHCRHSAILVKEISEKSCKKRAIIWPQGWLTFFKSGCNKGHMKDFWCINCCSKKFLLKNHYFGRQILAPKTHISETSRNWKKLKKWKNNRGLISITFSNSHSLKRKMHFLNFQTFFAKGLGVNLHFKNLPEILKYLIFLYFNIVIMANIQPMTYFAGLRDVNFTHIGSVSSSPPSGH